MACENGIFLAKNNPYRDSSSFFNEKENVMFETKWDRETGGIILTEMQQYTNNEWKPVYSEELRAHKLDKYWEFDNSKDPFMWTDGNAYFYHGKKFFELGKPETINTGRPLTYINIKTIGERLKPIDVDKMISKNRKQLDLLAGIAMQRIHSAYTQFADKVDFTSVSYSGGKDSTAMIDLIKRTLPVGSYSVLFIDTGLEFDSAKKMAMAMKEECRLQQIPFYTAKLKKDADTIWRTIGAPSRYNRWCCHVLQSVPSHMLKMELNGKSDVKELVYIGNRAYEGTKRSIMSETMDFQHGGNTIQNHPIIDWNSTEVYLYIIYRNLDFNEGYRKGLMRIGCKMCPMAADISLADTYEIYRKETEPWCKIVKDNYAIDSDNEEKINRLIACGEWKNRVDGEGTVFPDKYSEYICDGRIYIEITDPNCDWREWMKTIGVLSEKGETCRIDFRGKKYDFFQKHDGQTVTISIDENVARNNREFWQYFTQVFRKSCFCIGCYFCDLECTHGCIKSNDNGVVISDDCNHCAECHKRDCFVFKSHHRNRKIIVL